MAKRPNGGSGVFRGVNNNRSRNKLKRETAARRATQRRNSRFQPRG